MMEITTKVFKPQSGQEPHQEEFKLLLEIAQLWFALNWKSLFVVLMVLLTLTGALLLRIKLGLLLGSVKNATALKKEDQSAEPTVLLIEASVKPNVKMFLLNQWKLAQ